MFIIQEDAPSACADNKNQHGEIKFIHVVNMYHRYQNFFFKEISQPT